MLVPSENLSRVRLLLVGICGVEGVRLGTDQCSLHDGPIFPECRRRVWALHLELRPVFVVKLCSTLIVCVPGLPPNSKLIGFTVSGPTSFFVPIIFVPCVAACPPILADPPRSSSCWRPDCDVQPSQLVRTWNRSNNNSRHSGLFHSVLVSVPL